MGKVIVKLKLTNQTDLVLKKHKGQRLIPNPKHGDKLMAEEY